MSDRKIEIEILYESKELWRIYLATFFNLNNIFYMFFSFLMFGLFLSVYFLRKQIELSNFVDVALFSFLFTLLYGLVMSYFSIKNTRKLYMGKYTYIISEENVDVVASTFRMETNWIWFSRARETGEYFFLYSKSNRMHTLPKRCFDAGQFTDFKDLLRAKLGAEAYLKKS